MRDRQAPEPRAFAEIDADARDPTSGTRLLRRKTTQYVRHGKSPQSSTSEAHAGGGSVRTACPPVGRFILSHDRHLAVADTEHRLIGIGAAAPDLQVLRRRRAALGKWLNVVKLEEPGFRAPPRRSNERAPALVARPHFTPDRRRHVPCRRLGRGPSPGPRGLPPASCAATAPEGPRERRLALLRRLGVASVTEVSSAP